MKIPIEHTNIFTNGVNLHVVLAGPVNGRPVVLLHGFPEFWRGWLKQIEALAGQGFRVIVPDQRGYNLSAVPHGVRNYSLENLSADVIGLLDHFGLEKVCLVGHDWGAAVAWNVAAHFPERVEKLAILNVPHPDVMMDFLRKSPRQMFKSWYIAFFQVPWLPDWLMSRGNFAPALALLKNSGLSTTFSDTDLQEYRLAYANSKGLTGMINWYRAILRYPPDRPANPRLRMPVRILWGKQDVALSAGMAAESLKFCERGELFYFENATHWVQHDEAEAVNKHLLAFFE